MPYLDVVINMTLFVIMPKELSANFPTMKRKYWQNVDRWLSFALLHLQAMADYLLVPAVMPCQWGQPIPF